MQIHLALEEDVGADEDDVGAGRFLLKAGIGSLMVPEGSQAEEAENPL